MTNERAPIDHRERGTGSVHEVNTYQSERFAQRTASVSGAFFLPHLEPGMSLLDCGCGTGHITLDLAAIVAPGLVTGIDIHEERIREARQLSQDRGVENVTFELGSVLDLPFADNTFNAAFEHTVFQHLPDPLKAAQEVLRVLTPGGVFGAADQDNEHQIRSGHSELIRQAWELFDAERRSRGMDSNMGQRLRDLLLEAGFTDVRRSVAFRENLRGGEGLVRFAELIAKFFRADDMVNFCESEGMADRETLDQMAQEWLDWGQNPDAFQAGVNGEAVGWKPRD